jgi:transcriptional regulator with XRE-family HTH domain
MATLSSQPRVGPLLREWRKRRRRTQLDLALDAGISPRHLSFVETGRSTGERRSVRPPAPRADQRWALDKRCSISGDEDSLFATERVVGGRRGEAIDAAVVDLHLTRVQCTTRAWTISSTTGDNSPFMDQGSSSRRRLARTAAAV